VVRYSLQINQGQHTWNETRTGSAAIMDSPTVWLKVASSWPRSHCYVKLGQIVMIHGTNELYHACD
jgi:hypothetical protein